jgi:hypothetical protein
VNDFSGGQRWVPHADAGTASTVQCSGELAGGGVERAVRHVVVVAETIGSVGSTGSAGRATFPQAPTRIQPAGRHWRGLGGYHSQRVDRDPL